ncbi:hypothetical protein HCH_01428 [Hahella chejuensis KCTC 2396]|uniref:Uncharacterized protein n=1 Tax=Hahella chejuensis (strain KCTC 2396) TaxID=349521 RepID=Q2SM35_HAHCH|nr:hypothetical protein [Hahella chejuensis]ABC28289.1 hypothetical protein HCH_01428 [Hahella chejuensis KCTC 2396]
MTVLNSRKVIFSLGVALGLLVQSGCKNLALVTNAVGGDPNSPLLLERVPAPGLADILEQRDKHCQRSKEARSRRLERMTSKNQAEAFETIMIASCEPDYYPGVMQTALLSLRKHQDWSSGAQSFIKLMQDVSDSQQRMLAYNQKLKQKLEQTIEAIGAIEEGINQRTEESPK